MHCQNLNMEFLPHRRSQPRPVIFRTFQLAGSASRPYHTMSYHNTLIDGAYSELDRVEVPSLNQGGLRLLGLDKVRMQSRTGRMKECTGRPY